VVVVATGRDEDRLVAVARLLLEAEDADVEVEGALEVGDLEVHVADVHARIDRSCHVMSLLAGTLCAGEV
jgi:hypothetical protein